MGRDNIQGLPRGGGRVMGDAGTETGRKLVRCREIGTDLEGVFEAVLTGRQQQRRRLTG